jgi:hypothetical protein
MMARDTLSPEQCKELRNEFSLLSDLQAKAIGDAIYIGMSKEETQIYDDS